MGEELFTGVEMTQTATAPKPAPGQVAGTELDTWSSLHSCRQHSCSDSDPQLPPCMLAWEGDLVNLAFGDPLKPELFPPCRIECLGHSTLPHTPHILTSLKGPNLGGNSYTMRIEPRNGCMLGKWPATHLLPAPTSLQPALQ